MNILLFDNGTKYLPELSKFLSKFGNLTITSDSSRLTSQSTSTDLTILSGGHSVYVIDYPEAYNAEIEFIRTSQKPIIGLCLGAELIAYTFGAKLEFLKTDEKGLININVLREDEIFKDVSNFKVYENHKVAITALPKALIGLAKSVDGFEVIKHNTKPIYGFQFHPEMFVDKTNGDEIFKNLLSLF